MKVSREQVAANRDRIVDAAAALFRERGFDGVAVADVMQRAGLTHGAFYGYFDSKEALAAEAAAHALTENIDRWSALLEREGPRGLPRITDAYLSPRHRDQPSIGCPTAALGGEIARQRKEVRARFGTVLEQQVDTLAGFMPGNARQRRRRAIAVLAQLVGALVMARAVGRESVSDEILAAARDSIASSSNPST